MDECAILGRMTTRAPVFITGCSSGIGLATAIACARAGWPVIAGIKSEAEAGALPAAIAAEKLAIEVEVVDIGSAQSVEACFARIAARHPKLSGLVNNAGTVLGGFFEVLGDDELKACFEVNVFGTARVTRAAVPLLRAGAPSSVITVSSIAGRLGAPGLSAYHGAKFALEGLYECLALELAPDRIGVTLVEPGIIRTPLLETGTRLAQRFDAPDSPHRARSAKLWADFRARFERTGQPPETVARAIVNLLGRENPPLRVPVGLDARIILWIQKWMPAGLFWRLWSRLAG